MHMAEGHRGTYGTGFRALMGQGHRGTYGTGALMGQGHMGTYGSGASGGTNGRKYGPMNM